MENQPPPPQPVPGTDKPKKHLFRSLAKIFIIVLGVAAYTVVTAVGSIKLYQKKTADDEKARLVQIDPHTVVQDGLIKLLDTKTVKRHLSYRDNLDKSMLVSWDITSDFSNPRDPKSRGTLTIDYLTGTAKQTQKLEFIAVKSQKYMNDLYFRMVEGNQFTNAPKDWFLLTSSDIITFERKDPYHRDAKINLFGLNKKALGFDKFKGFNFFLYNNPAFYVIVGDMRESPEKNKIISEIRGDKAYVLQGCNKDTVSSWCGGSFNTSGMASILPNYATSEGLGSEPGLRFDSTQFLFVANNQSKSIEKLEVGEGDSNKFVVLYSQYDQPVTVTPPATFIK